MRTWRDLVLELPVVGRCLHATDAQARAGLVDEVDRLVGKVTVGDVAVGEVRRGHDRLVGDRDPVVRLVAVAQALQDLDRVRDRRLLDLDRLEPALERGVLLEVLAVLVERGGADRLQLAAGEHRLEDAGRVDRALGRARTHERVQLVDEQDDVAARADLLQHLLQALLEVAAVAGPGHQRAEVERVELAPVERLGHVALDDVDARPSTIAVLPTPGSPMSTGLFFVRRDSTCMTRSISFSRPMTGSSFLSRASWVRLRPNWSSTSEPARLGLARAAALGRALLGAGVAGQELDDLLADAREVGAELHEHLRGDALALADQPEEDVLGADVVVSELQRLAEGELEDLLRAGRERDVPDGAEPPWPMISSTWLRTASSEMPSDSSALAATPSPSWIRPSRMCSVPM